MAMPDMGGEDIPPEGGEEMSNDFSNYASQVEQSGAAVDMVIDLANQYLTEDEFMDMISEYGGEEGMDEGEEEGIPAPDMSEMG